LKRSKAETDTPIVPQMTVPQMLMMMQPYQSQKHVAAQSFQWYGSVSRCTTSSSSQASGAGAASTNVVASSEWKMEVCRCIVNLISIVKLSDFQFHMCVVIEILKKVS